ncbi:hypothetical protein C1H46_038349 [Malus baccata]|uniref:Uncharacterized protein n=1 Tax=Malus baccata TaxID=106549 RepID=A0A540KPL7_MALBA|nr:hypothetical protein C1H46_038349 [Malus baccata]
MIGLCSHSQCESSVGGLKPRLFDLLPENSQKTRGLLEFLSQRLGMRFVTRLVIDRLLMSYAIYPSSEPSTAVLMTSLIACVESRQRAHDM